MSTSARLIRSLDPVADLDAVAGLYVRAAAFWLMTDRKPPDPAKAAAFFTDGPPGCDPSISCRLGVFEDCGLLGVAELSFGFPGPEDAYLGLMLIDPAARGRGLGRVFLAEVERLARAKGCPSLFLAVLEENTPGLRFWQARGFARTGVSRFEAETGHLIHRFSKSL